MTLTEEARSVKTEAGAFVKLQPCPFCGNTFLEWEGFLLHCMNPECNFIGTFGFAEGHWKQDTVDRWNRRKFYTANFNPDKDTDVVLCDSWTDIRGVRHDRIIKMQKEETK